jgi:hypothetical protein
MLHEVLFEVGKGRGPRSSLVINKSDDYSNGTPEVLHIQSFYIHLASLSGPSVLMLRNLLIFRGTD